MPRVRQEEQSQAAPTPIEMVFSSANLPQHEIYGIPARPFAFYDMQWQGKQIDTYTNARYKNSWQQYYIE